MKGSWLVPNYELAAERAAKRAGINPRIFKAMIRAESNFNPNAGSTAGAQGIAQFMPGTAPSYGVNLHDGRVTDDLNGAAKYIKEMLAKTGGNYHQALSMYNAGPGRPNGYKEIPETIAYVKKIMGGYKNERLQDGSSTPSTPASPSSVPSVKTTKVTTPGVDNSGARASAALQFLRSKSKDPVYLAQQVQGLQDTPAVTKTTTTPTGTTGGTTPSATSSAGTNGRVGGGPLKELFWQGEGGINAKNGKLVPQGFVSGHTNHVHVASGPETTRRLGKLAQQMGLHVGENKAFGGVAPVHVQNSNHYSDRAIDVSGDPAKMRAFAQRVAKMYGIKS
jgi:hypothetical protein